MANLYRETMRHLTADGYTTESIYFISLHGIGVLSDDFWDFAKRFNYYDGYGTAEVPPFIIHMKDGSWYERGEYDGSEWWEHVTAPNRPEFFASLKAIMEQDDWQYIAARAALGLEEDCEEDDELDLFDDPDLMDELEAQYD